MPARKPIRPEDLFDFRFLSQPRISPDGAQVVYVERRIDARRDAYVSHLWLVPFAGGEPRRLTGGRVRDGSPRWSPDGRTLLFVRERKKRHLVVALRGWSREKTVRERVLLDTRGVPSSPCWSPDGEHVAFLFRPLTPEELEARRDRPSERRLHPRVIRRLAYREDGRGFLPDERNHVWLMDRRGREVRRLTGGAHEDHGPVWHPDGGSIVFMSNRLPEADYLIGNMDLWAVDLGGAEARRITTEAGPSLSPAFSPDGETLAFVGNLDPYAALWRNMHLRTVPAAGGPSVDLLPGFDRTCADETIHDLAEFGHLPDRPVWSADGSSLTFTASDRGACNLYRVAAAGGVPESLVAGLHDVAAYSATPDGARWALLVGDPSGPHEVFAWEGGAGDPLRRLTDANGRLLRRRVVAVPREVRVDPPDGAEGAAAVHGWMLRPAGAEPESRVPLVLAIHGGPMAMYGWAYVHEFQVLAAAGFAVLYTNPRGSQGYGEAHCIAIRGEWGGLDYRDLMQAVDWACAQPGVDAERLGVCGGSYGGFMTNWIVAHDRSFGAAITDRSISNLHSFYGTSDFGWDFEWDIGARPWQDPERYWRGSPLAYVESIRTPLLIVHGETDLRCPVDQADQLFAALAVLGREVEYVRYPDQSHGLSRAGTPSLRLDRLRRYVAWFEKHLMGVSVEEGEVAETAERPVEGVETVAGAAEPQPIERPDVLPER
jgi:dipeptidyl aminopeptidase/acylaminoacyl peptidase